MPLGQRIAYMAPKRRRRIRDLRGELLVGAGDVSRPAEKIKVGIPTRLGRSRASAEGFRRSIWLSRYLVFAERADHFFAFRALVASFHEEMFGFNTTASHSSSETSTRPMHSSSAHSQRKATG
jgi:hypothetical protein